MIKGIKRTKKKKTGRPLAKVDPRQVEVLASLGCTAEEIADVMGCSLSTLKTRFQPLLNKGRGQLSMSLKKFQFDTAKKGNPALLIWLGKQYLGQRDTPIELNTKVQGGMVHLNIDNLNSDTVIDAMMALDKLTAETKGTKTIDVPTIREEGAADNSK